MRSYDLAAGLSIPDSPHSHPASGPAQLRFPDAGASSESHLHLVVLVSAPLWQPLSLPSSFMTLTRLES